MNLKDIIEQSGGRIELIDATPQFQDIATDGACGLSWDDGQITSMTPAPAGRCPFEAFHEYEDDEPLLLDPDDIPGDYAVRPLRETPIRSPRRSISTRRRAIERRRR